MKVNYSRRLLPLVVLPVMLSMTVPMPQALASATVSAAEQSRKVTVQGTVRDVHGETMPGVRVMEKGTQNGALTDVNGSFSLTVTQGATLVFSYVGFKTAELPASQGMKVVLHEDTELLEEVVVVGYGTQKKENLTGAVSTVNVSKTLDSRPVADVAKALQGSTPGLNIVNPSGELGQDPTMRIRGAIGSLSGSAAPLILLDNVEIPSLSLVNPDDIESISVLKDAASTSIYGAKAAFGVVLITTKKGAKSDVVNVTYTNNFGWSNIAKEMEMATVDGLQYIMDWVKASGQDNVAALNWEVNEKVLQRARKWQQEYGHLGPDDPYVYGRDWEFDPVKKRKLGYRTFNPYDYMIREWAPSQKHNVTFSGRSGKTSYNIAMGIVHQNGVLKPAKKDDFKRYNASVRVQTDVNRFLSVRAGALYSRQDKNSPYATGFFNTDPWLYLYRWGPTFPLGMTEDGYYLRGAIAEVEQANTMNRRTNYTSISVGTTLNFTDNWDLKIDYNYADTQKSQFRPGTRFEGADTWWASPVQRYDENGNKLYVNDKGEWSTTQGKGFIPALYLPNNSDYTGVGNNPDHIRRWASAEFQNTLNAVTTYNLNLENTHVFKFMLGMNLVTNDSQEHWGQKYELLNIDRPQFDLATGTQKAGGGTYWQAQLGYFGRINYALLDRYLFEANLRYDGTSKFPTHLRWRWFPSVSAGWRISEEPFMEGTKGWLSNLKLRASYGVVGDQSVPNSLYVPIMEPDETTWLSSDGKKRYTFGMPDAVSPDITWQDIANADLGLEIGLWNNRLNITAGIYSRETRNMIVPGVPVADTFGRKAPKGNFGTLRTNGWELSAEFNHRFENGLGINGRVMFSDFVTKMTKYSSDTRTIGIDQWYEGKTYGELWGYRTDRLFQKEDFVWDPKTKQMVTHKITKEESAKYAGKEVNKQSGTNPVYQPRFEADKYKFSPGDPKFKDLNGDGFIDNGDNTVDNPGDMDIIGNFAPRYEYSFRLGADWKGVDLSLFFQGIGKRQIWGSGQLTIPGFNAADGAMPQAIAGNYWRPDRTDAFYPRAWSLGNENSGLGMQVQDRYLLNMAYLRLKNATLGYRLPTELAQKAYLKGVRAYVSLENFLTFDNLRGLPIDPETVPGVSFISADPTEANYGMGRAGVGSPTSKVVSIGFQFDI